VGQRSRRWLLASLSTAAAGALLAGPAAAAGAAGVQAGVVSHGSVLTMGMKGAAVKALQRRLNFLHYYAGTVDGDFGWNTMEAVWAFKEVQAGQAIPANADIVGPAMQRLLVHPKLPPVLRRHATWNRIEVNKDLGVLVLYRGKNIELISHVSTAAGCLPGQGCGWITPDGTYRSLRFITGWVKGPLGSMYNPVVFTPDGAYAIHGEPDPPATISTAGVPLNAASHGCVRIPMDISAFLHTLIRTGSRGTLIYIRGHAQDNGGV
jgi:hypothetical protein